MHKHFADWFREIGIEPTEELLDLRWAGVAELAGKADAKIILSLIPIYLGYGSPEPEFIEEIIQIFVQKDKTFPNKQNDNQLRILAGACIANLLEGDMPTSAFAAAAVVCGNFGKKLDEPPTKDILELSKEVLKAQSGNIRKSWEYYSSSKLDLPNSKVLANLKKRAEANNISQVQMVSPIVDSILSIGEQLMKAQREMQEANENIQNRVEMIAEEINALWWLNAHWSDTCNASFSSLDPNSVPIIAATELAAIINFMPGPLSSRAILDTVISTEHETSPSVKFTVEAAVNSITENWRNAQVKVFSEYIRRHPFVFPLHFAVVAAENSGGTGWQNAYAKNTKLKPELEISKSEISYQYFLESLIYTETQRWGENE